MSQLALLLLSVIALGARTPVLNLFRDNGSIRAQANAHPIEISQTAISSLFIERSQEKFGAIYVTDALEVSAGAATVRITFMSRTRMLLTPEGGSPKQAE